MKAVVKPSIFLMIYFILFGMTSMAISTITINAVQLVLHILCLAFHLVICTVISFVEGKKAMIVRIANDKIRLRIIETGDDLKYDKSSEYKLVNGSFMGVLVCAPVIIFAIISFIVLVSGSALPEAIKVATRIISGTPYNIFKLTGITATDWCYVLPLIAVVFYSAATTIGYYLGGRKQFLIKENFEERKRKYKEGI